MVRLHAALPEGARLISVVHDKFIVECRKEQAEDVRLIMVETMQTAPKGCVPAVTGLTYPPHILPIYSVGPIFDLFRWDRATEWLNSPMLTAVDLREKVVLVQFWTYTCVKWIRTLSDVCAWAKRYKDQGVGGDRSTYV